MALTTSVNTTFLPKLKESLEKLNQEKITGDLILANQHHPLGKLHVCSGRLLYIIDSHHRVRRFERAIKLSAPEWKMPEIECTNDSPWEYQMFYQGIKEKQLNLGQVKKMIGNVALEFLFELNSITEIKEKWEADPKGDSVFSLYFTLSNTELDSILSQTEKMSQEWQQAGLGSFKPSLAPLLKPEAASKLSSVLTKYLDGKYTLWDIGIGLKRNVAEITQYLLPLVAKGVIQLKEIPDLAAPKLKVAQKTTAIDTPSQASTESSKKLIACIDDSPVVAHNLKKILNPAGYEILTIDEPMHGFSKLIDYKPGLIFLDLNMPNADGYSVCQFLRNTHVFEKTPIIILTAQDTLIDRTRAKIVGATDFIGKPADPQKVLEMVKKHLN